MRRGRAFSHVDVGNAFQFINHISAVCLPPALYRSFPFIRHRVKPYAAAKLCLFSHVDVGDAFQFINHIITDSTVT